jgi:hypothetical protein
VSVPERRTGDERRVEPRPALGRRESDAAAAFVRELTAIRCSGCGKIICKTTVDAVRAGQVIEIKCGCNQRNYLIGSIDAVA